MARTQRLLVGELPRYIWETLSATLCRQQHEMRSARPTRNGLQSSNILKLKPLSQVAGSAIAAIDASSSGAVWLR